MKRNKSVLAVEKTVETYANDKKRLMSELNRLVAEGQRTGDVLLLGTAYLHIAIALRNTSDRNGILTNSLKAAAFLNGSDDHELVARAYLTLGYAYSEQGNYQLELENYDKAYSIIKKHRIKGIYRINAMNNLSTCYHELGDCKTAIRILTECLRLHKIEFPDDYSSLAMCTLNLAEYYKDNQEPEKSLEILDSMEEWIDKADFQPLICDYYLKRAVISYKLGDVEHGNGCTDMAFTLISNDIFPGPVYDDLSQVSRCLTANGDRARAERLLGFMDTYSENNSETIAQLVVLRTYADFCKRFGDFEKASDYYEKLEEVTDRRMHELEGTHLGLHKSVKEADAELSRLQRKMRKTEKQYSLEPMTKLLNRAALLKISSEFIETAAKKKKNVGAIFIDIDCFKECNDTYGHQKGDEIIREVARACKAEESVNVRFARYGGDEFFAITRGLSDGEVADVARRVCRRIREADIPNEKNPHGGRLTLSSGVVNVAISERANTIIDIANYADKALYHAKNAGRNAIFLLDHGDGRQNDADYVKIEF